jgi:hypothetical protein
MQYKIIREELKTGDVILFSGKGGISDLIKWFSNSRWSHVGMVIQLQGMNMVLLWESTTLSNITDLDTGRAIRGVQLVGLSERINSYDGEVAIRQLNKPVGLAREAALGVFRSQVAGRPYEENKLELLGAGIDGIFADNVKDLSSLFCSELVAEAFQIMGLLPNHIPSNEFTPADFGSQIDKPLNLLDGFSLGTEITISRNMVKSI